MKKSHVLTVKNSLSPSSSEQHLPAETVHDLVALSRGLALGHFEAAYGQGETEALFECVAAFGEGAFDEDWIRDAIKQWRERLRIPEQRVHAQRSLLRVGRALAFAEGGGRPRTFTEEETLQKKRSNDQRDKTRIRTRLYFEKAWQQYRGEWQSLPVEKRQDPSALRRIACTVDDKEFSGKTSAAKQQARDLFWKKVKRV